MPDPRFSVTVYERPGYDCWYARCYLEGEGGAVRRWSTGIEVGARKRESKRAAQQVAEQRAASLASQAVEVAAADSDTSLDAVAERMLLHKEADGKRKRTTDTLSENLDKHVLPFFGKTRDVRTIRRADLEAFKRHLHGLGRAPVTINNNLTAIRQTLKFAWRVEELLESVPDVPNVRVSSESKGKALTAEQVTALLAAVDPRAKEAIEWLLFLVNTGLRKTETLAIQWDWIDWDAAVVRIPAEYRKGAARQPVPVPLNDVVIDLLRARQARPKQPSLGRVWFQQKHDGARNSAAERAGLGRVRNHDLRHTLGSMAHAAGASLVEVRDLLGHTTLAMVSRYAHSYEGRLKDVSRRIQMDAPGSNRVSTLVSTQAQKTAPKGGKRQERPSARLRNTK